MSLRQSYSQGEKYITLSWLVNPISLYTTRKYFLQRRSYKYIKMTLAILMKLLTELSHPGEMAHDPAMVTLRSG